MKRAENLTTNTAQKSRTILISLLSLWAWVSNESLTSPMRPLSLFASWPWTWMLSFAGFGRDVSFTPITHHHTILLSDLGYAHSAAHLPQLPHVTFPLPSVRLKSFMPLLNILLLWDMTFFERPNIVKGSDVKQKTKAQQQPTFLYCLMAFRASLSFASSWIIVSSSDTGLDRW